MLAFSRDVSTSNKGLLIVVREVNEEERRAGISSAGSRTDSDIGKEGVSASNTPQDIPMHGARFIPGEKDVGSGDRIPFLREAFMTRFVAPEIWGIGVRTKRTVPCMKIIIRKDGWETAHDTTPDRTGMTGTPLVRKEIGMAPKRNGLVRRQKNCVRMPVEKHVIRTGPSALARNPIANGTPKSHVQNVPLNPGMVKRRH